MTKPPLYDHYCRACPLGEGARSCCIGARFSRTPEKGWHPKILFVGEAPGREEDYQGKPFVGAAGQLLVKAIRHYGISDYGITNTVKCRPPDNRKPRAAEAKACAVYLDEEIARFKPQIVVPLGAVALKRVSGLDKVTEWAGRVIEDERGFKVFPILHPAAVLRMEQRFLAPFEAQFKGLARLARGEKPTPTAYVRVTLREAVKRFKKLLESEGPYGFDVETGPANEGYTGKDASLNPRFNRIVSAAFSPAKAEAFWFEWPKRNTDDEMTLILAVLSLLKSGATMVAHNAVMEVKQLLWHVVRRVEPAWQAFRWNIEDSMLFYYLLHEDAKGYYGLESVRAAVCPDMADYDRDVMEKVNAGVQHHEIPIDELGDYNAGDADATLRVANALREKVQGKKGLWRAWTEILRPATFAIALCELNGRKIDFDQVAKLREQFAEIDRNEGLTMRTHPAVQAFCRDTDRPVAEWNPNSSRQVAPVVFQYLKKPVLGYTDGGDPSVKYDFLKPFERRSRFVRSYLAWKEARTLDNNYLVPYTRKTAPDGFLYGSYLQHGTATGRWASVNPNLQNFAPLLRTVVVSRFVGGKILSADYSQLELRLLAMEAGVALLLDAYRRNEDVHALTATRVCSTLWDREVTKDEILAQHEEAEAAGKQSWRKDFGKTPNFGLGYGAYPKKFAEITGLDVGTATLVHEAWHEMYPEVGRYLAKQARLAKERGWLESHFGRRRRLPQAQGEWNQGTPEWKAQREAFREAGNFRIQSLASDLNTRAFLRVLDRILGSTRWASIVPIGCTHDSQDYDVPGPLVEDFASLLRDVMVAETHKLFPWITVPLDIDVKAGDSWGSLKKVKAAG